MTRLKFVLPFLVCAVGAGVTGGSVLSLTAWIAVFSMWLGAVGTQITLKTYA